MASIDKSDAPGDAGRKRGRVLSATTGTVLTASSAVGAGPGTAWSGVLGREAANWRFWMLVALLPLFGQTFQYVVDVLPAYALTKAWPLLTLPLAMWGFSRLNPPYRAILLVVIVWTFAITPLIGIYELGDAIGSALATTAKVWSLLSALSCAALFAVLRTPPRALTRAVMGLGAATFVLMALLWVGVPHSHYDTGQSEAQTKLFLSDAERGYRIYMPMFFGLLFVFAVNRSFWITPRWWKPVVIVVCLALMLIIFKQRTVIGSTVIVVIIGGVLSFPRWRWPVLALLGLTVMIAAPAIWAFAHSASLAHSLGGSLTMRQMEITRGVAFLNAEPHRWVFGAGSATRVGNTSLADIVGARGFFLADLGWLGVIFEYGAIGVLLLLLLHVAGLRITWRAARLADPVARASFDYVLYILLVSPVLPVTFVPGELCTCMAMAFWYVRCPPDYRVVNEASVDDAPRGSAAPA